ncbi:MAG TPA: cobalamin B12-binding domain-containing protein, partial [Clostridiaceae bacterium]
MKVLLAAVNAKFIHSNLAVRYLRAYTEDVDYDCRLMEFSINDRKEKVLETLVIEKPDVVAFSCYIWNIEYVKYLSSLIRLVCPECIIMYGGPEVSFDSEEFLSANAGDFVIEGEGEETYRELILKLLGLGIKRENITDNIRELTITGLYTKADGRIHYGGKREFMNMERIAFPYDEFSDMENKIVYYEASR